MPTVDKNFRIDFRKDIFAIIFLAIGIFFSICLISYSPTDPAINSVTNVPYVKNLGGIVGAYIADILFIVFGISAYVTALLFVLMSILQFYGRPIRFKLREALCYTSVVVFAASVIHLRFEAVTIRGHEIAGGGIIGALMGEALARYLNRPGAYIISTAGLFLFFTLATRLSVSEILSIVKSVIVWIVTHIWVGVRWFFVRLPSWFKLAYQYLKIATTKVALAAAFILKKTHKVPDELIESPKRSKSKKQSDDEVTLDPIRAESSGAKSAEARATGVIAADNGPKILKRADAKLKKAADEQLKFSRFTTEGYEPAPLALLDAPERKKVVVDEDTLKKNSMLVEKKLKDFDVDGRVTAIHPGPVITMYEFEPATGTKVNKIVNLQDDLSLTLGGRSVRIIPHLPGKAAVGIEIPNSERETVWLKDILSSTQFHRTSSQLPLAFGSSTSGHPVVTDLTKMPHLLIAGATGSGKSVAINSLIVSMIYKMSPADVRFILVDPKMLELSIYDSIPHLLLPVVTKPKPAVLAMRWTIREMERRYKLMADTGTRNISGYNEKIKNGQIELTDTTKVQEVLDENSEAAVHIGTIPYIVIIIDELADLMMTASQDMEECITRLAQMARAAGIHLILATQRPSVDVITGLIKANFPARIAFKVTAKHDSRTILDGNGAETLLGNGDMLFMTPQGGNLIRIHGSYLSDQDISRVVEHLKSQGEPIYDESIIAEPAENGNTVVDMDDEDGALYDQAVKIVAETKQASISMVQRRLRIGYNRAARMIERMEAEGVVGPADGSKPRQVLVGNHGE